MKPRILVLGHYPLDVLDRAPKVRTYRMIEALAKKALVTVVTGTRSERGASLRQAGGLLEHIDAIYLESGSSTATFADLWFLHQAHLRQIPLGIFVRDAYQMFPDLYPANGAKGRILSGLYKMTLRFYAAWATALFVPTAGLGAVVPGKRHILLPPAGYWAPRVTRRGGVPRIVYVGAGGPHDGIELLLDAYAALVRTMPQVELWLVMRPKDRPKDRAMPAGVVLLEASGTRLQSLMQQASIAVIPRADTAYNRLALPVKLMDYLSQGLPVVVTAGSEAARVVAEAEVGLVVGHHPEALAAGLLRILSDENLRDAMSQRAYAFILSQNLWDHRADTVLKTLCPDGPL